jgi:hypothetical protein
MIPIKNIEELYNRITDTLIFPESACHSYPDLNIDHIHYSEVNAWINCLEYILEKQGEHKQQSEDRGIHQI